MAFTQLSLIRGAGTWARSRSATCPRTDVDLDTQFEVALKNQGKRGIWFSSWTGSGADAPWNTDEPQPRPTRCPHKFDEPTYVEGAPLHGSTASAHSPLQAARSESGTRHSGLRPGRR